MATLSVSKTITAPCHKLSRHHDYDHGGRRADGEDDDVIIRSWETVLGGAEKWKAQCWQRRVKLGWKKSFAFNGRLFRVSNAL